jgi:sugar-specific transcriptional regulator TrmB
MPQMIQSDEITFNLLSQMTDIHQSLATFGLNHQEIAIYLTLTRHPAGTVLQLSRLLGVKRTNLYRLLENLKNKSLITEQVDDKTSYYSAADIRAFNNQVSTLKSSLTHIDSWLKSVAKDHPESTQIKFYRGIAGLQYMEWQKCEVPHAEILILDSSQWHHRLTKEFAETIRAEMVKQDIHVREICNPANQETSWTDNTVFETKHYQYRHLDPKLLHIKQDIYIFNHHIHLQSYAEDDLVGIDLHSPVYAAMFTQIFNLLWNQAALKQTS